LRVMAEVVMVVTSGELEQPVTGSDVDIGVADDDISVADIRRFYGETNNGAKARGDAAFFHAARSRVQLFVSNHPLMAQKFGVDDQVRCAGCIRLAALTLGLSACRTTGHEHEKDRNQLCDFQDVPP